MKKNIPLDKKLVSRPEKGKTRVNSTEILIPDNLIVVGIGASAGGVEAFIKMVRELPSDSGMVYVLIQHLDPSHKSHLDEILTRETKLPVIEVTEGMHIKKDTIYLIPSADDIILADNKFRLSSRSSHPGLHLPIDNFFKSIALNYKQNSIGVVLSGTGADGSEGLKYIKDAAGITFVQDPKTCKFDGMPLNAIAALEIDFILPPEKIAEELTRISVNPLLFEDVTDPTDKIFSGFKNIEKIFKSIHAFSGIDFTGYKPSTIKRRISRRMLINKFDKLDEYIEFLKTHHSEVEALFNDLLITVTSFFRDPKFFDSLKSCVFPELTTEDREDLLIRLWVPGCSSGEEVYSLAITFLEYLETIKSKFSIQIFATDISDNVIDKARLGIFPSTIEEKVSPERLTKFFYKNNGGYQIIKQIRELCIFAKQDVSKDPPFSRIDIISCRNLLIYLNPALQKKVINTFHYALKPKGYLLLGSSETIGSYADLFTLTDKQHKIYLSKQTIKKFNMNFSISDQKTVKPEIRKTENPPVSEFDIQKETDKIILNNYAPSGVVVDDNMNIVQFRGYTGKFLNPSPGSASFNLFKMTNENLMPDLRAAFLNVKKTGKRFRINDIKFFNNKDLCVVNIEIIPMNIAAKQGENYYFIVFEDHNDEKLFKDYSRVKDKNKKLNGSKVLVSESKIDKLKSELTITKEYLQSIIEEREAANEELRSTLEELQSSNEELQSINEEMETAKEELQSTNEELTTVNEELQNGNSELNRLNNDLVNLLSNVHIPIIMLGVDLKIRRFTPSAEKVLNLISSDIGRPISDLRMNLSINNLDSIIANVINTLESDEIDVQVNNNLWYKMKVRPYKTLENKIDGVILAFIDMNDVNFSARLIEEEKYLAQTIIETVHHPVLLLDTNFIIKKANKVFYSTFILNKEDVEEINIFRIQHGSWDIPEFRKLLESILVSEDYVEYFELESNFGNSGRIKLQMNIRKLKINSNDTGLMLISMERIF